MFHLCPHVVWYELSEVNSCPMLGCRTTHYDVCSSYNGMKGRIIVGISHPLSARVFFLRLIPLLVCAGAAARSFQTHCCIQSGQSSSREIYVAKVKCMMNSLSFLFVRSPPFTIAAGNTCIVLYSFKYR